MPTKTSKKDACRQSKSCQSRWPGYVCLMPALFRKLDRIARLEGGCVLMVSDDPNLHVRFGQHNQMATSVYQQQFSEHQQQRAVEVGGITIANRIDISAFRSQPRPELDRSQIPIDKIYPFVVHFLIGHRRLCLDEWELVCGPSREESGWPQLWGQLNYVNQLLADRYAWSAVFGHEPLPRTPSAVANIEQTAQLIEEIQKHCSVSIRMPIPLPVAPGSYIPFSHVEKGIPWADPCWKRLEKGRIAQTISLHRYPVVQIVQKEHVPLRLRKKATMQIVSYDRRENAIDFLIGDDPAIRRAPIEEIVDDEAMIRAFSAEDAFFIGASWASYNRNVRMTFLKSSQHGRNYSVQKGIDKGPWLMRENRVSLKASLSKPSKPKSSKRRSKNAVNAFIPLVGLITVGRPASKRDKRRK